MQLTDELVDQLDRIAHDRGVRRSEVVRDALTAYVLREDEAEKERRWIEGYTRIPPGTPDEWGNLEEWGEAALRAAAEDGLIE